jgi:hypothetical protein
MVIPRDPAVSRCDPSADADPDGSFLFKIIDLYYRIQVAVFLNLNRKSSMGRD